MEHQTPPCKTFNKKRAITCYKLHFVPSTSSFEHSELFRVSNQTPGEYYVLPPETLKKFVNRHLSYHRSGAFHWREEDGSRVIPVEGEADQRRASLVLQAMQHLTGRLDGYCISRGRDVSDQSLKVMLEILDGYIIPPLKVLPVHQVLSQRKSFSVPMFCTVYQREARNVIVEATLGGDITVISRDELTTTLRGTLGDQAKVIVDPAVERFECYSQESFGKLMRIASRIVCEKMDQKPRAFWTAQASGCQIPI